MSSDMEDFIRSHRKPGIFATTDDPEPLPDVAHPNFGLGPIGPPRIQGPRRPVEFPDPGPSDEEWMREVGREVVKLKRESRGRVHAD